MAAHTLTRLWALARPKMVPYVVGLPLSGWAWAHWDRALTVVAAPQLVAVVVAWALLHAGTLWLNAAMDRDEGEVLLGRAVVPPPGVERYGYAALALAVGVAWVANPVAGAACAGCALLAVAYSHPRTEWKAHPVGGPFVNVVGYGILSPLAGWCLVGVSATPRTLVVWGLAALGILGMYLAAQAFQGREDGERGYRTLVVTHGPLVVLAVARFCLGTALLGGLALAVVGWIPRACLGGVVGWWVLDRWLVAWSAQPGGGDESWARGFTKRMLWTALIGIALAFGEYARQSWSGEPVAGLGTASGHPPDRPLLPPAKLRQWERMRQTPR